MSNEVYYIEPSALYYQNASSANDESILDFLNCFEELIQTLGENQCKFVVDSIIAQHLIDSSGQLLIPLPIDGISNREIREKILRLQQAFSSIVNPLVVCIETNACSIENSENIRIEPNENSFIEDKYYNDFFHSIIAQCYSPDNEVNSIVTIPNFTKLMEPRLRVECSCANGSFDKMFGIIDFTKLIDHRVRYRHQLSDLIRTVSKSKKEDIDIVQASHEPIIGNTILKRYSQIDGIYRRVFDILLKFGLVKIDFREWGGHSGIRGSIHNCSVTHDSSNTHDIVTGWLIIDDKSCKVIMNLPLNIGECLCGIFGNKLCYSELIELSTTLF